MKPYTPETSSNLPEDSNSDRHAAPAPRPGFLYQIPVVILTAAVTIGAIAWMRDLDAIQRATDLAAIRTQNEALRAEGVENRRQIETATKLLKDAIGRHDGEVFRSDEEIQKLNDARITQLADTIAKKVIPAFPTPKSAADMEQLQAEQVDKVATRFTENLRPMLSDISAQEKAATAQVTQKYEARVQELDKNLQDTQAAAQDA